MTFIVQAPTDAGFQPIANTDTTQNHYNGQIVIASDPVLGAGEFVYVAGPAANTAGQTVSSITVSGGIATMTTGSGHGLLVGALIVITGATPTAYNGTFKVLTVPSTTTVTFSFGSSAAYSSGATYVSSPIVAGQVVTLVSTLSAGVITQTATAWAGTVNTGTPLGVPATSFLAGTYGWVQLSGNAVVQTAGTPVIGNAAYWSASGVVQPTAVASKQMVNAIYATAPSVVIGTGTNAVTLQATQAVLNISRPFSQGAIT